MRQERRAWRLKVFAIFLLAFGFALANRAEAQVEGYTAHSWGIQDGLPDQSIQAIAQTPDGYLWIGTPHGLVRFDGLHFEDQGAGALPQLHEFGVFALLTAKDGGLWIGTLGGGVARLLNGEFHSFGGANSFQTSSVRALYQDEAGTIWAGSDQGLYYLKDNRFVRAGISGNPPVFAFAADGSGGMWFGLNRLLHFNANKATEIPLPSFETPARIRALAVGKDKTLWIGTPYGLLSQTADGPVRKVAEFKKDIRSLHVDPQGRLWIGTAGEGVFLRESNGVFRFALGSGQLPSNIVLSLATVNSSDTWIGTEAGVTRYSRTGISLIPAVVGATGESSLMIDPDNSVWLSMGRVAKFVAGSWKRVTHLVPPATHVRALYRDRSGTLWAGTLGQGAVRFPQGKASEAVFALLGSKYVRGFTQTTDGSVWIATDAGISRWKDGQTTDLQRADGSPHKAINSLATAGESSVWIGTENGLYLLSGDRYIPSDVASKLGRHRVWSLLNDTDGNLWIGAETGLYLWRHGHLQRIMLPQIPSSPAAVLSILQDSKHRLIVAETTSVIRMDGPSIVAEADKAALPGKSDVSLGGQPEIFPVAQETGAELAGGVPSLAQLDHSDGVWLISNLGLIHISADKIANELPPVPIKIGKVIADGKDYTPGARIVLPASTRNIAIQVSPILLSADVGYRLRYRLANFDAEWTELPIENTSIYGRLPPGEFLFRVEGSWPGQAQASVAEINIVQEAAIYRRPWFLASVAVGIMAVIFAFHQYRLRQVHLRFDAVMEERNRVAREMHDTLLQGCIGVSSLLEAVIFSYNPQEGLGRENTENSWMVLLQYAREQVTETIRSSRDAIWALRNLQQNRELKSALKDILESLTNQAGIETALESLGELPILRSQVQHEIVMAFREAVTNAVSHARSTRITVGIQCSEELLIIAVEDNGVGFDLLSIQSRNDDHFGLLSMRERLAKVGGKLDIQSNAEGSRVKLTLPVKTDHVEKQIDKGASV